MRNKNTALTYQFQWEQCLLHNTCENVWRLLTVTSVKSDVSYNLLAYILLFLCMLVYIMYCGGQRTIYGISSLLLYMGSRDWIRVTRLAEQVPLLTKASCVSTVSWFNTQILVFFFYIYCMYVCLHDCGDQRQLVGVFSLHHVSPGYGTQVLEPGNRSLNQLRHLSGLSPHTPTPHPRQPVPSFLICAHWWFQDKVILSSPG